MTLPTLFLRREPTRDPAALCQERAVPGSTAMLTDVVIYRDQACTDFVARFPTDSSSQPRRAAKTMMLNCALWPVQWLPPVRRQVAN